MSADTAKLLGEHDGYGWDRYRFLCVCGDELGESYPDDAHRAHLAAVLDAAKADEFRAAAEKALRDAAGDLLLACSHFNRYRNQPEWCGYCESAVDSMLGGSPDYKQIVRDRRTDKETSA